MSPGEAIAVGGGTGSVVLILGSLFVKRLFTRWLEGLDSLPDKLELFKTELLEDIDNFKEKTSRDVGAVRGDNDRAIEDIRRRYDAENLKLREDAHAHREWTGTQVGSLTNRVATNERDTAEARRDIREIRANLHRVDSNVVMIAASMGLKPVMPARPREESQED